VIVTHTIVKPESYDHAIDPSRMWTGGGPVSALRVYQAFHPNAAIYTVTYRGRTVWMTSKQRAIWHEVGKYWQRGKRDTLQRIASIVGCSRATVSRFLRRLDLWRFIDLATLRGRGGGTYIFTRSDPYNERPRRWTMAMRERVRNLMAATIRRIMTREVEPMLVQYRIPRKPWMGQGEQLPLLDGSTGATFNRP
jgi:predicted transcriptional regulator